MAKAKAKKGTNRRKNSAKRTAKPTAYVMRLGGRKKLCRVGHHNQTHAMRELQIRSGLQERWTVDTDSGICVSKWEAAAIEALTHAMLQRHSIPRQAKSGKKTWAYRCSPAEAGAVLKKAAKIVRRALT